MKEEDDNITITTKERKIVELIRSTEYGNIRIIIQDNEPIRVEEITKSIKL
jgi:hypothetical protein